MTESPTTRTRLDHTDLALAAAVEALEEIGPRAIARRASDGGWDLSVEIPHGTPPSIYPHLDPTESGLFPAASAGHRLIECGWFVRPCAAFVAGRPAGWARAEGDAEVWTAPVTPTPGAMTP